MLTSAIKLNRIAVWFPKDMPIEQQDAVIAKFGLQLNQRGKAVPHHVTCNVDEDKVEAVLAAVKAEGYEAFQDFLLQVGR